MAAKSLIVDASFLVALANQRDKHHAAAARLQKDIIAGTWAPILPDSVLLETANVLLGRRGSAFAVRAVNHMVAQQDITLVTTGTRLSEAIRVFSDHAQHGLGLTDCTIVAVAREFKAAVATFDDDFRKVSGLQIVP